FLCFLHSCRDRLFLLSFPTRRSSDLDEHFGVALVRFLHFDVAKMHVVDAIPRREPPAHFNRVAAHLARHTAVEGDSVRWAVHDADRKSTRLNSSHEWISYAVFCLKKK